MKPERIVEIMLWDWLKTKSSNIVEVYFNSKNELGWKTFKVKGCQRKPDLLIVFNSGFGNKICAVEVKQTDSSSNILDARKVIEYCKRYLKQETEYFIEDKKVELDYFLIATESSLKGYLFKDESLIDNSKEPEKVSKFLVATKYKTIPIKEGNRTFEFVRTIWNLYRDTKNDYNKKCGIGILIGNTEDSFYPHMMITAYDEKNKRWSQRWWKL
jgi:hypothetical protein